MTTRFAPSPTGLLHLGHAYAAMFARDLAHSQGGAFLLRYEDIDGTRVRDEYYLDIERDLAWLGIQWDGTPLRQTDRLTDYAMAINLLKARGVIYPCFCTRREIQEEIQTMDGAPQGPEGPLYPGTCRNLSPEQRQHRIDAGEPHCWRLDTMAAAEQTGPLSFTDRIQGKIDVDPSLLGDVILARKDIATSYHIAVVVDDAMQEISDVTRGEDLLASTHVHRLLQELLGLPEPIYHHHRLILDAEGKRLAKRDKALSIQTLRERGASPAEVLQMVQP
ncbi:tRNA glutamyl-Q(34) synthetase GluQRS [Verrucomicrobiaceae bacterium R5-34]|nr:tRNA glutamyl-Q(34) synthetase GluQRS [Verrucomicrobiaceae bacterium R5-34]